MGLLIYFANSSYKKHNVCVSFYIFVNALPNYLCVIAYVIFTYFTIKLIDQ